MVRMKPLVPVIEGLDRPDRLAVQAPVRFRSLDGLDWHEGIIENISRNGLLVQAEELESLGEVDKPLAITFVIPAEAGGDNERMVICTGHITRLISPRAPDAKPCFAVRITDYRYAEGPIN